MREKDIANPQNHPQNITKYQSPWRTKMSYMLHITNSIAHWLSSSCFRDLIHQTKFPSPSASFFGFNLSINEGFLCSVEEIPLWLPVRCGSTSCWRWPVRVLPALLLTVAPVELEWEKVSAMGVEEELRVGKVGICVVEGDGRGDLPSAVSCSTRARKSCSGPCGTVVVVVVVSCDAVACACCRGVAGLGAAIEGIGTLFTAGERTSIGLELGHAHGRESGGGVVLGSIVVNFVDRYRGVYDVWLDGLLVDNGLANNQY